jgi:hypothetical protein
MINNEQNLPQNLGYRVVRSNKYPSVGDQLEAIWKVLKSNNLDLSLANSVIEQIDYIKKEYPKEN